MFKKYSNSEIQDSFMRSPISVIRNLIGLLLGATVHTRWIALQPLNSQLSRSFSVHLIETEPSILYEAEYKVYNFFITNA